MKKRILTLLLTLALACGLSAAALAAEVYVTDELGVLTPEELNDLNARADDIYARRGIELMFSLTGDAGGDIDAYAHDRYDALAATDDGILMGVEESAESGDWYLAYNGRAGNIFTADDLYALADAYLDADTYYGGISDYLQRGEAVLAEKGTQFIPDHQLKPNLVDDADLLTPDEEARLLERLDELTEKHGCTVAVVTVDSMDGKSAEAFADDYYDYNGYGAGPDRDGLMLAVSMGERKWHITTTGRCIGVFSGRIDDMSGQFLSDLSDANYYRAFSAFADAADALLSGKALPRAFSLRRAIDILPMCGIAGLLVAFLVATVLKRQLKSVRFKREAADYQRPGSFAVTDGWERFVTSSVTRTERADDSDGGGGGSHTSSSGTSHGGGGGSF